MNTDKESSIQGSQTASQIVSNVYRQCTLFPPVLVYSVLHNFRLMTYPEATLSLQVCRRNIHPLSWQVS